MQSVVGEIYDGKVTGLTSFGAFVKMSNGETGMVHISEVAPVYVKDIHDHLKEGQDVKVKVLAINENNKISLSIKQTLAQPVKQQNGDTRGRRSQQSSFNGHRDSSRRPTFQGVKQSHPDTPLTFEEMMAKFKQESEEKMSDLKKAGDFKNSSRRSNGNGNR